MKKIFLFLLCWLMFGTTALQAQNANDYSVSVSSGTYTPITGTFLTTTSADDGYVIFPLPAPFNFCGTLETSIVCSNNGHLAFGNSSSRTNLGNALASASYYNSLAPFWDDLQATTTNGTISWELDDTDPTDSILTIQYENIYRRTNSTELLNFQVKLYYATGKIEFVYGAGFDGITATTTASIGINNRRNYNTYFISITPTGAGTMTYSTSTANNSIDATVAAHITSGTTYTFEQPTCISPANLVISSLSTDAATISWDNNSSVSGWLVSYMPTGGSWNDEEFISTNEYSWNTGDLTPNTQYTFRIRTVCDVSDTSNYGNYTFRTPCLPVAVPFLENFDGTNFTTGTAGASPCWTRTTSYSTQGYPYISTTYAASGTNSFYFYGNNTSYDCLASQGVDATTNPINTVKVKFKVRSTQANVASKGIQVGVMTDPNNISTFVPVGGYHKSATTGAFEQKEQSLASYQGTGTFIALRAVGSGTTSYSNTNYVDDFEIVELTACEAPSGVTATNVGAYDADIEWSIGNTTDNTWWLYHKPVASAEWDSVQVYDNPYTLQNLLPQTQYQVKVSTDCAGYVSEYSNTVTFTTACVPITTLPFTENFDNDGVDAFPPCWDRPIIYSTYPKTVSAYSVSSPYSLRFQSNMETYAILPDFQDEVDDFLVEFDLKREGTSSGVMVVGVMTDREDVSTFIPIDTINPADNNWNFYQVALRVPEAAGKHTIAFKQQATSSSWYYWLDNVVVDFIPDCMTPINLTASNITDNSMELSWDDVGTSTPSSWIVRYTYNNNPYVYEEVYSNPCTISNLPQNMVLNISVAGLCNGTDTTRYSESKNYGLACMTVTTFPWKESFEGSWWLGTGLASSTTVARRWCWINVDGGSTSYRWQGSATAFQGTGAMYCSGTTTATTVFSDWFITPVLSLTGNQFLRFNARGGNAIDTFSIRILDVSTDDMTDYADTANFVVVGGVRPVNGTYNEYEFDLSAFSGDHRIAFHRHSGGGSIYVDEVMVNTYSSCVRVSNLYYENETNTTVDVGWTDGNTNGIGWWVYYKPVTGTEWDSTYVTSNPATISSLNSSSVYNWYVKTDCGGLISEESIHSTFMTECDIISNFPWSEGFETDWIPAVGVGNKPSPNCWTVIDRGGTNGSYEYWWKRGTTTHSGSGAAQCYTDYGTTSHNDWLITPQMTLTGNERLRFWAMRSNSATGEPDEISIFISDEDAILDTVGMGTYDTMPGFTRIFHQDLPTGNWARYEVNLNQYTGNRYIAFVRQGTPDGYNLRLDDVVVEPLPDCTPPHSMSIANLSQTGVDIHFLPGNVDDGAWRVYYKATTTTNWDSVDLSSSPAQLTGLTANTSYQYYMITDCGDEISEVTNTYTFTTPCNYITIPYLENFDTYPTGSTMAMSCWTRKTNYSATANYPYVSSTYSSSSSNSLYFYGYNTTYECAAASPVDVAVNPINTLKVKFKIRSTTASALSLGVQIGVMTDPNDYSTFVPVGGYHKSSTTTAFEEKSVSLASYTGAGNFIAIRSEGPGVTSPNNYNYVDDFEIVELSDCEQPDMAFSNITINSADISISAGNINDNAWWLYYKQASATDWDSVYVNTNPFTLTSIQPSTAYQVYLRTDCGNELSLPSYTKTFQTPCGAIGSLPIMDDFNNYGTGETVMPTCWTRITTQANRPYVNAGGVTGNCLYFYAGAAGTYNIAVMPEIDASIPVNTLMVSFDSRAFLSTGSDSLYVGVMTDPTDASTFELVGSIYNGGQYVTREVVLSSYTGTGQYIAFKIEYDGGTSYAYIDNLVIDLIPACPNPQNFTASQDSPTSALLTWDEDPSVVSRTLEYKLSTDATWTTDPNVTASPYIISSLTAENTYNFRLKLHCGGTDESNYRYANTYVGYHCIPVFTGSSTSYYTTSFNTSGANTTDLVDNTACTALNYYDRTSLPFEVAPGDVISFTATYAGGTQGIAIWIDADDNYFFEANERLYNTTSYQSSPHTATFTIPASITDGTYRMRVQIDGLTSNPSNPCQNNSGNIIDYAVVVETPTCPNPQNFTATQSTPTSAILDWTESSNVVSRILEYKLSSDATWTVDPNVTAPPYTLASLTADNTYDFRLKFNCGGTDESNYKYATAYVGYYCYPTFTGTSTTYYTTSVTTTGASVTDLNDNTVCTQKTYYDRTALPFEVLPGDVITFTTAYLGGTQGIAIWVDLDNSYSFEASERVYNTTSYQSTPHSGTVTIPGNTPNGTYRVRIQMDGLIGSPSNPCQNSCGNIIDYAMVVGGMATPCNPPTNLTISDIRSNSVVVSWTAGGTETTWDVEYKMQSEPNYGNDRVTQTTTTLLNLEPNTTYDVRVKAICGTDDESEYVETTFTTREAGWAEYTLTPIATFGGEINPSQAVRVEVGGSQTFTFTPNANYALSQVLVDDVATSYDTTGRSYTFTNVQADHTIKGVFTLIGSVDDYVLNNRVIIYPNPANSTVNVKTEVMFQTVEITNILGQVIYTSFVNDTHFQLNVAHLNAGVYFIRLQGENGTAVKKLVVE